MTPTDRPLSRATKEPVSKGPSHPATPTRTLSRATKEPASKGPSHPATPTRTLSRATKEPESKGPTHPATPTRTLSRATKEPVSKGPSKGLAAGIAAYAIWGLFPLYFDALRPTGAWEILANRIVWTALLCLACLAILRDWSWIPPLLRHRKLMLGVTAAALLIAINWVVYIAAVTSGHTSDAALGYFLNPLVTVALGVVVLSERLRPLQWIAVGIGGVAGIFLAIAGGTFPWMALTLAASFALYGLVKNKVGATLPALHSLTMETLILLPVAAVIVVVIALSTGLDFGRHGPVHTALLVGSGVATAIPLLLFAAAARRIPLVTVGLIQFITPVVQLLCAVLLLGEHVSPARWIGFGIVWVALLVLSTDALLSTRRRPLRRP